MGSKVCGPVGFWGLVFEGLGHPASSAQWVVIAEQPGTQSLRSETRL